MDALTWAVKFLLTEYLEQLTIEHASFVMFAAQGKQNDALTQFLRDGARGLERKMTQAKALLSIC